MFGLSGYLQIAIFVAAFAGVGGIVYTWHYKPIRNLQKTITIKINIIEEKDQTISSLKLKIQNQKVQLIQCKEDVKIQSFESDQNARAEELDKMTQEFNSDGLEDNTTKNSKKTYKEFKEDKEDSKRSRDVFSF